MNQDNLFRMPKGDTVGRTHFIAMGGGVEYSSIFDGNPLTIASFIGSQGTGTVVTVENRDEDVPFLYIVNGRVKKCTDKSKCPKLKKYLRYLRWVTLKKKEILSHEEAESLLRERFHELRQYASKYCSDPLSYV
ncbi:hypothetical protein DS742_25360 [Lacrimispora amygdalina]|uniref:Uncharacterized protein n=1 Tax=Lacrimispora amygdalina TaxID=253257 RepID=A0A3E2N544_9FIRM|nr:hypothetical protein [Clostridium indicum]RFZ76105.1 hypothetical protein DS742_25360 [Clostridium indicum]